MIVFLGAQVGILFFEIVFIIVFNDDLFERDYFTLSILFLQKLC